MLEIQKYDKIIVANWKLNGSFASIEKYLSELKSLEATKANICGVICPPSIYLHKFSQLIPSFYLGSQDCSNYEKGAYTGEISASMINDISCRFCIVGHSERRQFFNQKNIDIQIKVQNLIQNDDFRPKMKHLVGSQTPWQITLQRYYFEHSMQHLCPTATYS